MFVCACMCLRVWFIRAAENLRFLTFYQDALIFSPNHHNLKEDFLCFGWAGPRNFQNMSVSASMYQSVEAKDDSKHLLIVRMWNPYYLFDLCIQPVPFQPVGNTQARLRGSTQWALVRGTPAHDRPRMRTGNPPFLWVMKTQMGACWAGH